MQRRRYRISPALLILGVLLTLCVVAPTAVGATELNIQFTVTQNGQKGITLSGNGFGPGEKISLSGFVNNGQTVQLPDAVGNAIGAFDMTIAYNPSVFRIKASGQLTGLTTFADVGPVAGTPPGFAPPYPRYGPCYYFDTGYYYNSCPAGYAFNPFYGYGGVPVPVAATNPAPAPAPAPAAAPVANSAPTAGYGTVATVGQAVTITATGFTANEQVAASVTDPSGAVTQIGMAPASPDGAVSITITFPASGNWQITAHGQTSGKDVVNRYAVNPA